MQGIQGGAAVFQHGDGLLIFKGIQILVGVVTDGVKMGQQSQHIFPNGLHPGAHTAFQLCHGGLCPQLGLGVDQIGYRLGFGEIQPPGQKGPFGELAGGRRHRAQRKAVIQHGGNHRLRAVAVDLYQIFAGIGIGGREAGGKAQVDG